jgi:hypothetical protein
MKGLDANVSVVEQASSGELHLWLEAALRGLGGHPLYLFAEPSVPAQLQTIHARLSIRARAQFAEAVSALIDAWRPDHGASFLRELLRTVAFLRLPSAATSILATFERVPGVPIEVEPIAIGVLAGLAPAREAQVALRSLQAQSRFRDRGAAQIMIGLCICEPHRYPEYLEYFMEFVYPARSVFYDLRAIIVELFLVLTPGAFVSLLHELRPQYHRVVCTLLNGEVGRWEYIDGKHAYVAGSTIALYKPMRISDTVDLCAVADLAFDEWAVVADS